MKLNETQLARLIDQARSLVKEEKHLHAIQIYTKLINSEPFFLVPYFEVASLYAEIGQHQAGISILHKAEKLFADNAEIIYLIGSYYLQLDECDRALTYYKKIAGRKLPQVHFNMGVAYYYKNNFRQSEEQFRLALKYDPNFPKVNDSLGELLLKRQAYTDAVEYLKRGIEKNPYNAVNHYLLGVTYSKLDNWKKANEEFEIAVDMDPEQPLHWQMCGESSVKLKRYSEAESYLLKALELAPDSIDALVGLGQILSAKGDMERAMEFIKKALDVDPKNIRARSMQMKIQKVSKRKA